jgi:hypothetical protein
MKILALFIGLMVLLTGCERTSTGLAGRVAVLQSPAGWCVASVHESVEGQNTGVLLDFDDGRCGSGAVHFRGTGLKIGLRWIGPDTLEVEHPSNAVPQRNASGEMIQCGARKVRVVLLSRHPQEK